MSMNDDVKMIIAKYERLKEQSSRLILNKFKFSEVKSIDYEDDDLIIYYETYSKGAYYNDEERVPIEWLFLDDRQLEIAKQNKRLEDLEIREKEKKLNDFLKKQAQEQKDREEYARLKAKFER